MKSRPSILITNDDGIWAPGIKHLWQALKDVADVFLVAPLHEQSGVGLSLTVRQPLHIQKHDWHGSTNIWSVSGTPADCVKLALREFLEQPPDFVVSGINRGGNAGRNVLYSGTLGGAIEGTMQGIPSVAFSCDDFWDTDYSYAVQHIPKILRYVMENPLPEGTLLNVNFPAKALGIKGFKLTRQGKEYWAENPDKRFHPAEEQPYYWLGARRAEFIEEEDCDVTWMKKGYVVAVPIQVHELTDHRYLSGRERNMFGE